VKVGEQASDPMGAILAIPGMARAGPSVSGWNIAAFPAIARSPSPEGVRSSFSIIAP
jgi:hypothetical protein